MLNKKNEAILNELDQELEKLEQLVRKEELQNESLRKSILEKELFLKKLEQYGYYINY